MTRVATFPNGRRQYKCDICGKLGPWGPEWSKYSSIAMEESCPSDIPTMCSDTCVDIFKEKLKSGAIVLPKLKTSPDHIHMNVVEPRKGY